MSDDFEERREIRGSVPDHQILLSFVDDEGAEHFSTWLALEGKAAFLKWCGEVEE